MQPIQQQILNHWFAGIDAKGNVPEEQRMRWWKKDPDYDTWLREHFTQDLEKAVNGEFDACLSSGQGRLALIILCDQFSRQIYRDRPQAFIYDELARSWALQGIAAGEDQQLFPVQRVFFYMPLEHAENLKLQDQCVALFEKLYAENKDDLYKGFLDYAIAHRDVIARFNRFPHRNKILNRESSAEEIEFLKQPNSSF